LAYDAADARRPAEARMLNPLLPTTRWVQSRRWIFWVNSLAASPYVSFDARKRIYRRVGMEVSPECYEIGAHCYFHSADIVIGPKTRINDYCYFENVGRISIGRGVGIGMHAAFITSAHEIGPAQRRSGRWSFEPITLGDGCWVGARSTVLPGVTIGAGAVIAAGSTVTGDCEPNCIYGGNPARLIRRIEDAP
jgi:maltose O-acetyltransferase